MIALKCSLLQKQKLEALGNMAGGIAHNFNNYMSIILGNLEICEANPKLAPELDANIANAKTAVLRSRELVHKILTFSKASPLSLVPSEPRQGSGRNGNPAADVTP